MAWTASPSGEQMKALVVVGHPAPASLNHAIAATIANTWRACGCAVSFRDLQAEGFPPLLTPEEARGGPTVDPLVLAHIAQLRESDLLAVVHPNCWGAPPAIVKGWIDRVFAQNAAFTFAKGDDHGDEPIGLLKVKAALVINTGNTPMERERTVFADPLEHIWRDCILRFCGVQHVLRSLFGVVATSTLEERQGWLDQAAMLARRAIEIASAPTSARSSAP